MSALRGRDGSSFKFYGCRTIELYPKDKVYEEAAFIAYYFHWSQEEIMQMSHLDRIRWCGEISRINSKLNDEPENVFKI